VHVVSRVHPYCSIIWTCKLILFQTHYSYDISLLFDNILQLFFVFSAYYFFVNLTPISLRNMGVSQTFNICGT
jgi:hypothetical protein